MHMGFVMKQPSAFADGDEHISHNIVNGFPLREVYKSGVCLTREKIANYNQWAAVYRWKNLSKN